jgi:peroxiredoxin
MPKVELNAQAPDFALNDHQGKLVKLSELRGKNVLLVFNRTFM